MQLDSFVQLYSSKTDDELLALASSPDSLVEEARPILADELRRRSLVAQPAPTENEYRSAGLRNSAVGKFLRTAGAFWLNLVIAVFGTAIVESFIWALIGPARSQPELEAREWLFSLTIAALLGFVMCRCWPNKSAMWVWVLPVALFGFGVLLYGSGRSNSVLVGSNYSEHFFAPHCLNNPVDCRDFIIFTIPAARAVAYSLAALVSLRFQRQSPTKLKAQT